MNTLIDAFMEDICAHPEDDTPRLIYADWLEDNGDPFRAEFIRLQIEQAAIRVDLSRYDGRQRLAVEQRLVYLTRRERQLLAAHKNFWCPSAVQEACIFGSASPEEVAEGLRFVRGFISQVCCGEWDWLQWGKEAVREAPIQKVSLAGKHPSALARMSGSNTIRRDVPMTFVWESGSGHACRIEGELFRAIKGGWMDEVSLYRRHYATRSDAVDALSAGCIHWARN